MFRQTATNGLEWTLVARHVCMSERTGPAPLRPSVSRTMTALKFSISTAPTLCAYALLLPLSILIAAVTWANKVSGVLYVCSDSIGIFDFIPPFVNSVAGDVYYVPAWRVYLTWYALLAGAFLLPALMIWFIAWFLRRLCAKQEQHDA